MKMKFLVCFLFLAAVVAAIIPCQDGGEITIPCYQNTPKINCSTYNYTIRYTENNSVAQTGNLSLIPDSNSEYNFTIANLSLGNYSISLCSGHSASFQVVESIGVFDINLEDTELSEIMFFLYFFGIASTFLWYGHRKKEFSSIIIGTVVISTLPFLALTMTFLNNAFIFVLTGLGLILLLFGLVMSLQQMLIELKKRNVLI